jgi:hypothetical protein
MTGDKDQLGKKSRAGLALLGGYQIKKALAIDQVAWFPGMNNIPHLPHPREPDRQGPSLGPLKQKKDRPCQLVPVFKKCGNYTDGLWCF